jgi:hypothetical protein
MILAATLKRESIDGENVRYVDSYGGKDSFLSGPVVVRASDLPDPPPALLRVSLSWYQAPRAEDGDGPGEEGTLESTAAGRRRIAQGDRVKVIKSRIAGVRNPAQWLDQYLGEAGVVLWVTPDGATVNLGDGAVWFAYDELLRLGDD